MNQITVAVRAIGLIALGLMCAGGCAPDLEAAHRALPNEYPAYVLKWHDDTIDQVQFLTPFSLRQYERVVVAPVDTSAAPLPPPGENTHEPVVQALARSTSKVTEGLANSLKNTGVPVEAGNGPGVPAGNVLVLRSRVAEMDPGSQAARYWVGMGAGHSLVGIEGDLIEGKSGRTLLRFRDARASSGGAFGGGYAEVLDENMHEVGEDVGVLLGAFAQPTPK
jgi:hypothetical protein